MGAFLKKYSSGKKQNKFSKCKLNKVLIINFFVSYTKLIIIIKLQVHTVFPREKSPPHNRTNVGNLNFDIRRIHGI